MSKKTIIILVVLLVIIIAVGAVSGYYILSNDGPYVGIVTSAETGEPIEGVSVTDGRHVVKTDSDGAFKLKGWRKTRFITVTAPAGYWTENYYIAVDRQKTSYDFTLEKSDIEAGSAHTFMQISDTEIGENGVGEWKDYLKDLADEEKPAFLIHTGDICYEPGLKRHLSDMNTENMGLPVRYIIGNHDYVSGDYGEQLFESIYGPVWYSFEVGNVHYVVTPFQTGGDYKSGYNKNDRWRWLENDLENTDPDMKVVIFNHNKPVSDDYVIEFDRKELDLKKHNLIAWVFGHYHYNYVDTPSEENSVLAISTGRPDCGGIDQSPSSTRIISIDENGTVSTKLYYYDEGRFTQPDPENTQLLAALPSTVLFGDPIYDDGMIYVATVDDNWPRQCGIYCINAETGDIVWETETVNSIKNNLLLENGKIIAQDCQGNLYCLNAQTGEDIWSTFVALGTSLNTSTGICTDGKTVYAGCAAYVTAVDIETGETVWSADRKKGECSAAEFILNGNRLIISSHWDSLTALDKNTGKTLWENKDEDIRFRSSTPAVIDENTLLVADSDAIMTVDATNGKITYKADNLGYNFATASQPLIENGIAYITTADKGVVAYDIQSGQIIWNTQLGRSMVYTASYTSGDSQTVDGRILDLDGTLVFGASDGNVYRLDPQNGNIIQQITVGTPIFSTLAYDGSALYAAGFTGGIYRINNL